MQKKGVETNLGHLLKKIFINFFVNFFFVFFKKLRQSQTEILIIVSIFKCLWAIIRASRNQNFLCRPTMVGDIFLRKNLHFFALPPPSPIWNLEITCRTPCTYFQRIIFFLRNLFFFNSCLTLSRRRPLSYRNQSIDLLRKSMDWFLYHNGLRLERVNLIIVQCSISTLWKRQKTKVFWCLQGV